ncbi:formimidoylglutamate deiminase [Orrella sp. 11846]|uniref:formimidoylglutamate deiminase n=1 Tax=Orrella sp. 11846 TaxID=3409913 RepID=UPI003B5A9BBE
MKLFAQQAWIQGQWAQQVLLEIDSTGHWTQITPNITTPPADAQHKSTIVPGITNAHSHAFQRAMSALTERGSPEGDNFWRWRQTMYQIALSITPDDLREIATQLYRELLDGGYSHVCEFHYVHHDPQGRPYADPAEMCWALVQAAQETGIGLTLLPTLYMHRGFGNPGLQEDQRRFAGTPDMILDLQTRIQAYSQKNNLTHRLRAGVAIHSLRAVDPTSIRELTAALPKDTPIHIHIAEQKKEVEDCLAHLGARPVQWLTEHIDIDHNWHLVHATHTTPQEIQALAKTGASVVICPTTEANLGDGVFDLTSALKSNLSWSIGTDSHVNRDVSEELRLLEYSQRLTQHQRNIASNVTGGQQASATVLFERALQGGHAASGLPLGGLAVGQRADWFELDLTQDNFWRIQPEHQLDAWIFSTPSAKLLRNQ